MTVEFIPDGSGTVTVGDVVVGAWTGSLADDGLPLDLSTATSIDGEATSRDDPAATVALSVTYEDDGDVAASPSPPWTVPAGGVWELRFAVHFADGSLVHVAPSPFYVADPAREWTNLPAVRNAWRDAPSSDVTLGALLAISRRQVSDYGPRKTAEAIAAGGVVPDHYVDAHLMQARNIWNARKTDPSTNMEGAEPGFTFTPFPLDWTVQQMIRPRSGKPVVR